MILWWLFDLVILATWVLLALEVARQVRHRVRVRRIERRWLDERVLLGPVSAWVAEGEARATREWSQR